MVKLKFKKKCHGKQEWKETYLQGGKAIGEIVKPKKVKMSWFHHICECGFNIHDVEYTNEVIILTCRRCGKKVKK